MSRREIRRKEALATANKTAYLGLAIGLVAGLALFLIVFSVAPSASPEQLAASVKAQAVYRILPAKTSDAARRGQPATATAAPASRLAPAAGESPAPPPAKSGYQSIGFDKLSAFPFFVTHQMVEGREAGRSASIETLGQIPDAIKALNGKPVSIRGFMLPMKYNGNLTTEFLLLRNQSLCCYGLTPKITEWAIVRMTAQAVKPVMDEPVAVCGILHVGDVRENGDLVGIYRIEGDQLRGPGQ